MADGSIAVIAFFFELLSQAGTPALAEEAEDPVALPKLGSEAYPCVVLISAVKRGLENLAGRLLIECSLDLSRPA